MIYATESILSLQTDVQPFLDAYYAEVGREPGVTLDMALYGQLSDNGVLRLYSAREAGMLAGFVTLIVAASNLHHAGLCYAAVDSLYVRPRWRGLTGKLLMAYAEAQLSAEGVKMVSLNVPKKNDWTPLAESWGYAQSETVMHKWL